MLRLDDFAVEYYPGTDTPSDYIPDDEWLFIRKSMNYIGELVMLGDDDGLSSALGKLKKFQEKQADGSLPSAFRLGAERLYNSFPPLFPVTGIYLLAGFVLLGWFVTCLARRREVGIRIRLLAVHLFRRKFPARRNAQLCGVSDLPGRAAK